MEPCYCRPNLDWVISVLWSNIINFTKGIPGECNFSLEGLTLGMSPLVQPVVSPECFHEIDGGCWEDFGPLPHIQIPGGSRGSSSLKGSLGTKAGILGGSPVCYPPSTQRARVTQDASWMYSFPLTEHTPLGMAQLFCAQTCMLQYDSETLQWCSWNLSL